MYKKIRTKLEMEISKICETQKILFARKLSDISKKYNTNAPLIIDTRNSVRSKLHNMPNNFGEFREVSPKLEKTFALIKKPRVIKA
jgi:hypothetical protein|tara:strand:+ start:1845 stop:2102 length:258 start_codon:yes stop_codon:yes gene_type:complete